MKKNYLFLMLLLSGFTMQAQVINAGFENIFENGRPKNWGLNFLQAVTIDMETGETTSDVIVFDNYFHFATTDAHTGQRALEIHNAFNETQNIAIAGGAMIFADPQLESPGWNPGVPIAQGVPVSHLGFYYKFFPVGSETAHAILEVLGENGTIGTAEIEIAGTVSDYTYIAAPVSFTSNETPLSVHISFAMGPDPEFGSRLLIDDVEINDLNLNIADQQKNNFRVFPGLADTVLNILAPEGIAAIAITDISGKTLRQFAADEINSQIDVSSLASGMYFINAKTGSASFTAKFIKK